MIIEQQLSLKDISQIDYSRGIYARLVEVYAGLWKWAIGSQMKPYMLVYFQNKLNAEIRHFELIGECFEDQCKLICDKRNNPPDMRCMADSPIVHVYIRSVLNRQYFNEYKLSINNKDVLEYLQKHV